MTNGGSPYDRHFKFSPDGLNDERASKTTKQEEPKNGDPPAPLR